MSTITWAALASGSAALLLTIYFFQQQQSDYRVQESTALCERARFTITFQARSGDADALAAAKADADRFCAARDTALAEREVAQPTRDQKVDALSQALEDLTYPEEASK